MAEKSIRDLIVEINERLDDLAKSQTPKKNTKHFPRPLTSEQKDVMELAFDDMEPPFTMGEFHAKCEEIQKGVMVTKSGTFSEQLKCYLAERQGLAVRWSK